MLCLVGFITAALFRIAETNLGKRRKITAETGPFLLSARYCVVATAADKAVAFHVTRLSADRRLSLFILPMTSQHCVMSAIQFLKIHTREEYGASV